MNYVFDCDGVILNSNRIKTDAFYEVAAQYGNSAAEQLVQFHVSNGGVSRYKKFEYLLAEILKVSHSNSDVMRLSSEYAQVVKKQLLVCEVAPGLMELKQSAAGARWFIVSGGDQEELRYVFSARGLSDLFDGGIYGSPDTKDEILARQLACANLQKPAVFFGDSKYDHRAATKAGLQFVFVYGWSEVPDWNEYCKSEGIRAIPSLSHVVGGLDDFLG